MLIRQRLPLVTCASLLMASGWMLFGPARPAQALAVRFVAPLPRPLRVLRAFDLPAQPWLPGNRGVDLAATTGEPVVAAADGVVVYAGPLAGRGVVSISHGDLRTTYEPVDPMVRQGERVTSGEPIARVSAVADGCGPPGGCLHWGAIRGAAYIDPMNLLMAPHVRLLPIWADGVPTTAATADGAGVGGWAGADTSTPGAGGSPAAARRSRARADSSTGDARVVVTTATLALGVAGAGGAVIARRRDGTP